MQVCVNKIGNNFFTVKVKICKSKVLFFFCSFDRVYQRNYAVAVCPSASLLLSVQSAFGHTGIGSPVSYFMPIVASPFVLESSYFMHLSTKVQCTESYY